MYLLDTDTLTHLWANHELVVERLFHCPDSNIGTTSISKCEILRVRCENLLKGATPSELLTAQQRLDRSEFQLAELMVVPFDVSSAAQLTHLMQISKLRKIGRADLLIASIALANNATLVTRNLKHFRQIPKLKLENWVD